MRDIKVASRYAKALLKIAIEENTLEELNKDMFLVSKVCADNRDLKLLLKSPTIKPDKKQAILNEIFEHQISQISNSFISIILTKKREGILADIADSFIDSYKTYKHITTAFVTTALPITKEQKTKIIDLLKKEEQDKVDLKEIIDENVIGGIVLRVGDKQVDESIKRKLKTLEMEFDENPYIKEY